MRSSPPVRMSRSGSDMKFVSKWSVIYCSFMSSGVIFRLECGAGRICSHDGAVEQRFILVAGKFLVVLAS